MTVLLTLCFKLIYEIIKKTCHRAYHHYGFAVTHALWHIWGAWIATKASQWQPWDHIVFMILYNITPCVKSVHIRSYSGPHFSRIFPHLDWIRRDVSLRFQSECRKMWENADQNNSEYWHFLCSEIRTGNC